ncbi:hypothetical protein GCM10023184_29430 [Flaviaesturariibacter amylovorans]|uniref:Uncharacterized protein n=1 Tax=Flaviaesturariibacter amylovorans TaxID=1084520 RepID=A0ABP8H6V8_9BACT
MCQVSDKIKFCTCSNLEDINELDNYWVFHTYVKGKNVELVGEPLAPPSLITFDDAHNRRVLLERVNDPGAFDIPLHPKERDRLQVSFSVPEGGYKGILTYGFRSRKGKWVECEYESFDWYRRHDETIGGEAIDSFE